MKYPPGKARLRSKSLEWCALEHLHRLVLADLLDELLEMRRRSLLRRVDREATAKPPTRVRAVLAKLLRNGVLRERDRVGFVGRVELHLAGRRELRE